LLSVILTATDEQRLWNFRVLRVVFDIKNHAQESRLRVLNVASLAEKIAQKKQRNINKMGYGNALILPDLLFNKKTMNGLLVLRFAEFG